MTRRLTIVLDDSVTETECGECRFRRPHPVSVRADICTNDGLIKSFPRPLIPYGERTPECLEAERTAARMVEIDTALVAEAAIDCIVPNTISADAQEAASKIESILREHARKAGR